MVYVATYVFGNVSEVALFELNAADQSRTFAQIKLPTTPDALGGQGIHSLAVTPDNRTLLATSDLNTGDEEENIPGTLLSASIPVPTGTSTSPVVENFPEPPRSAYYGLAVTPDQAPVARVGVSTASITAGGNITFNAGPSSVAFGSITGYNWSVTGGSCNSLTAASITCHFTAPGSYTAQVVETDSAGNSTAASGLPPGVVDFTGNTASLVPSNLAKSTPVTVTVKAIVTTTTTTKAPTTTTKSTTTTTVAKSTTTTTVPKITLHPKLTANPALGPPGFVTEVSGTGFPPKTSLTVTWSVGPGSVKVTSSATGAFSIQMLVMTDVEPGNTNAQVTTYPTAKAPFLVVPGSLQPGGDDFSVVYDR